MAIDLSGVRICPLPEANLRPSREERSFLWVYNLQRVGRLRSRTANAVIQTHSFTIQNHPESRRRRQRRLLFPVAVTFWNQNSEQDFPGRLIRSMVERSVRLGILQFHGAAPRAVESNSLVESWGPRTQKHRLKTRLGQRRNGTGTGRPKSADDAENDSSPQVRYRDLRARSWPKSRLGPRLSCQRRCRRRPPSDLRQNQLYSDSIGIDCRAIPGSDARSGA